MRKTAVAVTVTGGSPNHDLLVVQASAKHLSLKFFDHAQVMSRQSHHGSVTSQPVG
jgi:hypothetical protein